MRTLILLILLSFSSFCNAQQFPNTLERGDDTFESPRATLEQVSWIAGYWKGEAFGGLVEELWTPPFGGSMSGVFKAVLNDKVLFYEIFAIIEDGETLMLKLRHFDQHLIAWEEKDEVIEFPLVKVEMNRVYFSGFTFEKIDQDHINLYVIIGDGHGKREEVKFSYSRNSKL